MKIHIKDTDIELQYCMRMYLKYEERTGKSMSFEGMSSFTGITDLLYAAIAATLEHKKYRNLGMTLTYEEFKDWSDDQNPNEIVTQFNDWLFSIQQAQQDSIKEKDEATEERDPN